MFVASKWTCVFTVLAVAGCGVPPRAFSQTSEPPPAPAGPSSPSETTGPSQRIQDEITVTEETDPSLTAPSVEKAARELGLVAGGTSLVPAETFERGRVSTLKDVLDFTPGVFVQSRFGSDEARLSIRGSGLQRTFHGRGLKLLQDGVPLNLADGGFDFQAVEPLAARYVEVYRGANALELGSSTLGGAINYVSRSGYDAPPFQARVESGAFGYLRGQASFAFAQGGRDGFLSLTHASQDGFRDHGRQSNQRLVGNFGLRRRDDFESRLYLAAFRSDSELPGNLTKAQLAADPSQAAAGNVALDQKRDFDLYRIANRTTWLRPDASRIDLSGFYAHKKLDHPIFQVLDQRSDDLGVDLRYEKAGDLRGRRNRFVVGITPAIGLVADDRFQNVAGRRGAPTAAGKTTSTNVDLFAENRHELRPNTHLSLGLVATYAARDFEDDFLANGDQTDLQVFRGVNPKIGLLVDITPRASVFANLSRSFEPPSFGELANVGGSGLLALDAQTATTLELGSRGRTGRLTWDVALYHARVADELLSLNDGQGNPLGTINAGRTLHQGAEIGLEARTARPRAEILLRQTYNWSRFVFDGDPVFGDNTLAGIPEHFLRTELLVERGGLYFGPNLEWVPSRYPVDHANTLFADPYTLWGAKIGYRTERGWGAFVEGKNLTGETYAATTGVIADARGQDSAQFLPGDGRSVFAGIDYRF